MLPDVMRTPPWQSERALPLPDPALALCTACCRLGKHLPPLPLPGNPSAPTYHSPTPPLLFDANGWSPTTPLPLPFPSYQQDMPLHPQCPSSFPPWYPSSPYCSLCCPCSLTPTACPSHPPFSLLAPPWCPHPPHLPYTGVLDTASHHLCPLHCSLAPAVDMLY